MNENRPTSRDRLAGLVKLSIAVVCVWLASWLLVTWLVPTWSDRGTFGDMFGAVNSLFSGLAFAGVIYTILLQQQELSLQREEMRLARQEARRIADSSSMTAEIAALAEIIKYYDSELIRLARDAHLVRTKDGEKLAWGDEENRLHHEATDRRRLRLVRRLGKIQQQLIGDDEI